MAQQTFSEQPVPTEVSQVAAAHKLGTLNTVYKPGYSPAKIILMVLCLLFALLFFVAWYTTSFVSLPAFSDSTTSQAPLFFLGFLLMLGFVLAVPLVLFFKRTLRVYLYANGLVRAERNTTEVIRWDQVVSVTRVRRSGSRTYNVIRNDGKKIVFDNILLKVDDLGQTIAQESARHLFPQRRAN